MTRPLKLRSYVSGVWGAGTRSGDSIRGAGKSSATGGLYCLWPIFDHVDGQKSTLGERLNSCVKQQQQPFHESEMLCVQHAGSSLLVVFFSL